MSRCAVLMSVLWVSAIVTCPLPMAGAEGAVRDDDWPQWRGADRSGVSPATGLLKEWPEGGPPRVWLIRDVGLGYSGPAVVGKMLWIMGAQDGVERLLAIDVDTGAVVWSTGVGPLYENNWGDGPRGTPTVDGPRVYALGAQGALLCADAANGSVIWRAEMQELGGSPPNWGYAESLLIDGDKVVCTPGGDRGSIAALDKLTGKLIWQSADFVDDAQYASLIIAEHEGVRQYIQLTMEHAVGVAADDGRVLWTTDWPGQTAVIPTPIQRDGLVYLTSGYGVGCRLIELGPQHEVREVYANKYMKNQHGGVVLLGEHLYGYSDGRGWICQDFRRGTVEWSEKSALGKGCLTCADGKLYCLEERKGEVVLVEASPAGWSERGRFKLEPTTELRKAKGGIWTHPVVAGGRLYLRDQELLFCFDVRVP